MALPSAPIAMLLSLVPAILLFVLGHWCLIYARSRMSLGIVAYAVGAALMVASVTTAATYSVPSLQALRESRWFLAAPLISYAGVMLFMARSRKVSTPSLVLGACLGLIPIYFLGMYTVLLSACGYGDCL
jgi:hypothetical protein